MKAVVIVVIALLVAGSFVADYKWRKWLAERRREHDRR
jgi:hypothetical protein